jgi:hypothetical protein
MYSGNKLFNSDILLLILVNFIQVETNFIWQWFLNVESFYVGGLKEKLFEISDNLCQVSHIWGWLFLTGTLYSLFMLQSSDPSVLC